MALTRINAQAGHADFSISGVSYRTVLDTIRIRELIPMDPSAVFSTEGTNDQEPMASQLVYEIGGINTYGVSLSGPLIPAPQNVAMVATYTTGCYFTMITNTSEAWADRLVNQQSRIGARGMTKGIYGKTWDITT